MIQDASVSMSLAGDSVYLIETLVQVTSRKTPMTETMGTQFKRTIRAAEIEPWPTPTDQLDRRDQFSPFPRPRFWGDCPRQIPL